MNPTVHANGCSRLFSSLANEYRWDLIFSSSSFVWEKWCVLKAVVILCQIAWFCWTQTLGWWSANINHQHLTQKTRCSRWAAADVSDDHFVYPEVSSAPTCSTLHALHLSWPSLKSSSLPILPPRLLQLYQQLVVLTPSPIFLFPLFIFAVLHSGSFHPQVHLPHSVTGDIWHASRCNGTNEIKRRSTAAQLPSSSPSQKMHHTVTVPWKDFQKGRAADVKSLSMARCSLLPDICLWVAEGWVGIKASAEGGKRRVLSRRGRPNREQEQSWFSSNHLVKVQPSTCSQAQVRLWEKTTWRRLIEYKI